MRIIIYDFPDACHSPAFLKDFNETCKSLGEDDYPHIMGSDLVVDVSLHTDAPRTMIILCKPDYQKSTRIS